MNNNQQLKTAPGASELNLEILSSAFTATTMDEELKLSQEDANSIIQVYFQAAGEKVSQDNLEEGNAFLEANKAKEGITTTESGLQYEVITEGSGAKPTAESQVRVHYHGTLLDGTVFDSSVDRGDPAVFGVGGVIKGWTEVLQLMPVGSKWKVYIPADLAYGERGAGADIGPNSTLIFEVELLEIVE